MTDRPTEWALPGVLGEIAHLTSVETAIAFAREVGGRTIYVPESLKHHHRLIKMLGRQAALIICEKYGGDHLRVPSGRTYLRWHDARRLRRERKSISQISRILGIAERRVWQLLEGLELPEGDAQQPVKEGHEGCPVCGRRPRRAHAACDDRQLDLF